MRPALAPKVAEVDEALVAEAAVEEDTAEEDTVGDVGVVGDVLGKRAWAQQNRAMTLPTDLYPGLRSLPTALHTARKRR